MDNHPSPPSSFIDPKDVLSQGAEEPATTADMSSTASHTDAAAAKDSTSSQDNPKKKRKSWGQVLPVPTTNLPPRKRAKTAEEKAQRHYERVQRNRLAAHNSRMRKQDEMDRVVAENNRLIQDNQHQATEIKRLEDELAYLRKMQTQATGTSRPLTPPMDTLSSPQFTDYADPASPPSLTSSSSNEASSPAELMDANQPPSPLSFKALPQDLKQFNDSHSAVDVELAQLLGDQGWMNGQDLSAMNMNINMNLFGTNDMMVPPAPQQQQHPASATDLVTFDDFLNLEGLDESSLQTNSPIEDKSNSWSLPATGFNTFGSTDFSLFPTQPQNELSANACF